LTTDTAIGLDDEPDQEAIYEEPEVTGPPVDRADDKRGWLDDEPPRKPIIPTYLRRDTIKATIRHTAGRLWHTTAYHAVRVPGRYVPLALLWSTVGFFALTGRQLRWWWLLEQHGLRQEAATRNDADTWLKLHREARLTRRWRGTVLLGEVIALAVAALLAVFVLPVWLTTLGLLAAVPLLAHYGRPADKPIVSPAVVVPKYRRLTAELVRSAIVSIGVAGVKEPGQLTFPQDIHRDGPGQLAIVDLPGGVDAVDVIERRSKLASGLRVPLDQVWPEPMPRDHPGRLALWVGYEPASAMKQPPWPLLKGGKVDVFKPFPLATDPRLRTITGSLMYRNWLVGAMPGAGKTFFLRLLLLAAALDPRVDLRGYELKGTGDLDPLEKVCAEFGSGADDDTAEDALEMLRWLRAECVRRGPIIKRMAKAGKAPENKVTPDLAGIADLGLRPIVAFIDECQELFSHSKFGAEAGELAEKVIKLGRALGIILLLATQRPDKDSLPKGVSANAGVRFCLRVTGQVENDMVLGTSKYKQGIRATMFGDEDLGWGWLVGLGKPVSCRGFYVDGPAAERVIARAVDLRREAGVLPVAPADRGPGYDVAADVRAVWPDGETGLWLELLLPRLQRFRPEVYADWSESSLSAALKARGVASGPLHRKVDGAGQRHPEDKGFTRHGPRLDSVEEALKAKSGVG
jgi:S-DNA-T family DNA segregation ATPase FtsK/SpoIIIE